MLRHLSWLSAAALFIWFGFHVSGLDAAITRLAYDPAAGGFPLKDAWLLSRVGHDALKWTMVAFWAACLALPGPWRRGAVYMLAAAVVVTLLKQSSAVSCPWDLARFGSSALPPGPGRCLPAGHPVAGFMLFGLYFALRDERPDAARAALVAAMVVGLLAGAVQVARGAHFVSHVLWTAWVAWTLTLLLDAAWRGWAARRRPAPRRS